MYIISCVILFVLCVIGLTDITRFFTLRFLKIKNDKSIILISPLGSEPDNTEVLLRSCITRIRWMGRLRPDRIILLDTGICRNTKSICTLFQKEYEYIEVMTPSEFLMEFSSSKEEFISSEEL